jgi:hypothetical protein
MKHVVCKPVSELRTTQTRTWLRSTALFLLLPICIVGFVLLAKGLYPADLPSVEDPDFIDTIFDNRAVLWVARLLLVSAAGVLTFGGFFIVISIGIRMKNGEWLRRAGPFEISEATLSEIEGQRDRWRIAALLEHEKVVELTERLEESDELIAQLRTAYASGFMVGEEHP